MDRQRERRIADSRHLLGGWSPGALKERRARDDAVKRDVNGAMAVRAAMFPTESSPPVEARSVDLETPRDRAIEELRRVAPVRVVAAFISTAP